jgi:hypothetical protein
MCIVVVVAGVVAVEDELLGLPELPACHHVVGRRRLVCGRMLVSLVRCAHVALRRGLVWEAWSIYVPNRPALSHFKPSNMPVRRL